MSERLSPQESLAKIDCALQLLDAIRALVKAGAHSAQIVIPFMDVTVTLGVTVTGIVKTQQAATETTH